MTGIGASQKEKDLSRLLYRTNGSSFVSIHLDNIVSLNSETNDGNLKLCTEMFLKANNIFNFIVILFSLVENTRPKPIIFRFG